jgi:activator of HSP90 ATPase
MPADALTRRTVWGFALTGAAALGLTRAAQAAPGADDLGISNASAEIHQEVVFKTSPARLYEALTDAGIFQKVVIASGAIKSMALQSMPAQISLEPGGAFALFGGYITGRQLELEPGVRIIQVWRSASWAPHLYSIARFEISKHPDGAKLVFDQTGFPSDEAQSLAMGWRQHYWAPLKTVLAG